MSRSDKLRAVAQQAHDNGDCVCCLPDEMVEFERAKQTTITITISRADAEILIAGPRQEGQRFRDASNRELDAIRAALEAQHEYDNSPKLQALLRRAALKEER